MSLKSRIRLDEGLRPNTCYRIDNPQSFDTLFPRYAGSTGVHFKLIDAVYEHQTEVLFITSDDIRKNQLGEVFVECYLPGNPQSYRVRINPNYFVKE